MDELQRLARLIADEVAARRRRGGGPRSRIVEAIAVLLLSRPMRASEIASILGYPTRYISSYLSYWKTRGLFRYENGLWMLTEEGREFAQGVIERYQQGIPDKYVTLAQQILTTHHSLARNDQKQYHGHGYSQQSLPFLATLTSRLDNERQKREYCAKQFMALFEPKLSEEEREILQQLLDHYIQWGRTYTYADQLQSQLNAEPAWLLRMLRALQAKGLVYIFKDKRLGIRVGLSREAKQLIESCLADPSPSTGIFNNNEPG